jgi:RHS repeat-associated protein
MHPEIVRHVRDRPLALKRDPHRSRHHLIGELLRSSHSSAESLSARTSSWPRGLRQTRDGSSKTTSSVTTAFTPTLLGLSHTSGPETIGWIRDVKGKLVARRNSSSSSHYYLHDALGSVAALTDASGDVARRYVYNDPYGEDVTVNDSGIPVDDPWRFAGAYRDVETNLYKMGARYYQTTVGRWTQRDPLNQAFSPREGNRYAYVGGDPINLVDPTGQFGISDVAGAVAPLAGVGCGLAFTGVGLAVCGAGVAAASFGASVVSGGGASSSVGKAAALVGGTAGAAEGACLAAGAVASAVSPAGGLGGYALCAGGFAAAGVASQAVGSLSD